MKRVAKMSETGGLEEKREKPAQLTLRGPSHRVELARGFFLFGDETGRRVSKPQELADKVGCHVATIYKHLPEWMREHKELLSKTNKCEMLFVLSEQVEREARGDVEFLRSEVERLEAMIREEENPAEAKRLRDQWLSMQSRWMEISGVSNQLAAARSFGQEQARAKARMEAQEQAKNAEEERETKKDFFDVDAV